MPLVLYVFWTVFIIIFIISITEFWHTWLTLVESSIWDISCCGMSVVIWVWWKSVKRIMLQSNSLELVCNSILLHFCEGLRHLVINLNLIPLWQETVLHFHYNFVSRHLNLKLKVLILLITNIFHYVPIWTAIYRYIRNAPLISNFRTFNICWIRISVSVQKNLCNLQKFSTNSRISILRLKANFGIIAVETEIMFWVVYLLLA